MLLTAVAAAFRHRPAFSSHHSGTLITHMISAATVKELREKTNAGMMDCKKVLTETNGDMDAAIKLLRERGIAKAGAKADRAANEGVITARIHDSATCGILLEVNSETPPRLPSPSPGTASRKASRPRSSKSARTCNSANTSAMMPPPAESSPPTSILRAR